MTKQFDPLDYLIFEATTGSRLYGTNTPESDYDSRGICVPPMEVLLDPFIPFEVKDSGFEEEDRAIYALAKWMKLCADANPNIVELLFIPDEYVLYNTKIWEKIMENRIHFLSTRVKYTFTGYAISQVKAVERHRRYFINPPDHKPSRKEFGLTDSPLVTFGQMQAVLSLPHEFFTDEIQDNVRREKAYRDAKQDWDNYWSWKENRNPKRRETEERFGYDTKFMSHVFRLMDEGKELLLTGNITFPLLNAEWIKEIKQGLYPYDEVIDMAKNMEKDFEMWYEQSVLPHKPNRKKLTELYFEVIGELNETNS